MNPDTALCTCGHTVAEHADPAIGDTRCLVVGARAEHADVFDDGRDTADAYCACLRFTPAPPDRTGVTARPRSG